MKFWITLLGKKNKVHNILVGIFIETNVNAAKHVKIQFLNESWMNNYVVILYM
jgi:hypothetical protein